MFKLKRNPSSRPSGTAPQLPVPATPRKPALSRTIPDLSFLLSSFATSRDGLFPVCLADYQSLFEIPQRVPDPARYAYQTLSQGARGFWKNYADSWLYLLLRLPPVVGAIVRHPAQFPHPQARIVYDSAGVPLLRLLRDNDADGAKIPPEVFAMSTKPALELLRQAINTHPERMDEFLTMLSEIYIYEESKYRPNEILQIEADPFQVYKDRYYVEVIQPVLELYHMLLDSLPMNRLHATLQIRIATSPGEYSWFDILVVDRNCGHEVLPVLCLNHLTLVARFHSPWLITPEEENHLDRVKLRWMKNYLLLGRCKSVLVTDFHSSLLVQIDLEAIQSFDYTRHFREDAQPVFPLRCKQFKHAVDTFTPLKFGVFALLEMEFVEDQRARLFILQVHRRNTARYFRDCHLHGQEELKKRSEKYYRADNVLVGLRSPPLQRPESLNASKR